MYLYVGGIFEGLQCPFSYLASVGYRAMNGFFVVLTTHLLPATLYQLTPGELDPILLYEI